MPKPLRSPLTFFALTFFLAGWLHAWTLPTRSMWWTIGDTRPQWLELRQHRPLFWIAATLTGTNGRGNPYESIGCFPSTGPVVIRTDTGTRVVRPEALSVILESETVLAAAYELRSVRIDEFGLLAVSAVRSHSSSKAMPIAGLPVLGFEEVRSALYPGADAAAAMAPSTRWNSSTRGIIHDTLVLIALSIWTCSASGIPRWPIWRRCFQSEPPA